MRYRSIGLLSAGHLCVDMMQGALPALLPFLITTRHLNYTTAGGLIFASSVASSIVQPAFGYFADRLTKPWLMPLGLCIAGIGMSLVGVVPVYWAMALVVALCGLGVAAFHPEGARLANALGGKKKATAMSIFSVGGNAGFAFGPLLVTGIVLMSGLHGTLLLAIPCISMGIVLLTQSGRFTASAAVVKEAHHTVTTSAPDDWESFARLSIIVVSRSIVFFGLMTFLPLYWIDVLHQSKGAAATALTVFTTTGIIGTLIGGRLADRWGYVKLMRVGFLLLIPLFFLFIHATPAARAMALLVPLAIAYYAPYSAMVVLGQQYLPNRVGLASGVTLGLSVSIGGAMAPLLGRLADQHGIPTALFYIALLPVVVAVAAFTLRTPQTPTPGNPRHAPVPVE